jgi:hypothetical protein
VKDANSVEEKEEEEEEEYILWKAWLCFDRKIDNSSD